MLFTRDMLALILGPDTALVDQELARFRAIDKEKERVHKQKLKGDCQPCSREASLNQFLYHSGFLNKAAEKKTAAEESTSSA